MRKVVGVTGGTGFIGTHLVKALYNLGVDVRLFPHPPANIQDIKAVYTWIYDNRPDVLFHLAAKSLVTYEDDREILETNNTGTQYLYHACHRIHCPDAIIHISTDKVYGHNGEARRDSPLNGVDHPYNASKLCGDVIAQMYQQYYKLPIRIIRTGNIYGPGDTHTDRIIPGTIQAALKGKRLDMRSDGTFVRDYIYVEDLIPAYLRILDEPEGVYNLGGEFWSALDLVKMILRLMDREYLQPVIRNNHHNEIKFQHVVDCPDWWKPATSLRDGLERTIEWHSHLPG